MTNIVGERIKQLRLAREFTLEQLSAEIGVTKQMICKYEQGKSVPSRRVLIAIARVLGVKTVELMREPKIKVEFLWH